MDQAAPDTLSPLFIIAPAARCGITLLQRLLNSTRQILIYGENTLLMHTLPMHLIEIEASALEMDAAREKLLGGTYDFWSSSVWPDTKEWRRTVVRALQMLAQTCERSAAQHGFARWGVKNPLTNARSAAVLRDTFPAAKFVFIYRHVVDVLRSYKARQWLRTEQQCAQVTRTWCKNVGYMLPGGSNERLLLLRYEDMIAAPEDYAARLEGFVGVEGIDRGIFNHKLNTFVGEPARGYSPTQYIQPEELTEAEQGIVRELVGDMLERLGYPGVEQSVHGGPVGAFA